MSGEEEVEEHQYQEQDDKRSLPYVERIKIADNLRTVF